MAISERLPHVQVTVWHALAASVNHNQAPRLRECAKNCDYVCDINVRTLSCWLEYKRADSLGTTDRDRDWKQNLGILIVGFQVLVQKWCLTIPTENCDIDWSLHENQTSVYVLSASFWFFVECLFVAVLDQIRLRIDSPKVKISQAASLFFI